MSEESKYYLLIDNGNALFLNKQINPRGFSKEELEEIIKIKKYQSSKIICINDEIIKYNLTNESEIFSSLPKETCDFFTWFYAYMDNNLNGFSLPIRIDDSSQYFDVLNDLFDKYLKSIDKPGFIYEDGLYDFIECQCNIILEVVDKLIKDDKSNAKEILKEIIYNIKDDVFLVSDLDNSYSFRAVLPSFCDKEKSDLMLKSDLTFYRARTKNKKDEEILIESVEHMYHLPYSLKDKSSSMRFNLKGKPALYLGTTTYVCSQECEWVEEKQDLYASVFVPNSRGKKLRILNLTVSQALINGFYDKERDKRDKCYLKRHELQNAMLKIFPLVMAISFSINNHDDDKKYHYLLSQLLMEIVPEFGIDGIAYLSMKGKNEFQFPQGVNLTIITNDISKDKDYSDKCQMFKVSKPIKFNNQVEDRYKSFINEVFAKYDKNENELYMSKIDIDGEVQFYGDTKYGKFDNYLYSNLLKKILYSL